MTQAEELKALVGAESQRKAWLEELGTLLPAGQQERIGRILELVGWLLALLEMKNLSIAKLRSLCFGAQTESTRNLCHTPPRGTKKAKIKGHGRHSHRCYTGARRVRVPHPSLSHGQPCPGCRKGKLRLRKEPAVAIQVKAQPPIGAVIHEMEHLRCDTCGKGFTAPTPPEAGVEKYDPSVGVMVGL